MEEAGEWPHYGRGNEARIVALADFYDALTHERPYKRAWTHEEAVAEMIEQRERHFDPLIVDAFLKLEGCGAWQEAK